MKSNFQNCDIVWPTLIFHYNYENFELDKVPLIPLPSVVLNSSEYITLDDIKLISAENANDQVLSITHNFISFWKKYIEKELLLSDDLVDGELGISIVINNNLRNIF